MVKRLIRSIRQKPKGTRDAVAFGGALVFTLMVFTVWAFNTPARMAAIQESYITEDRSAGFGSLFGGIKDQFATAVESINLSTTTDAESEAGLIASTTEATSGIKMPTVEETINNINQNIDRNNTTSSTSTSSSTKERLIEPDVSTIGREVRIITTQPASSTSSSTP
jgi:hypothetical protein